MKLRQRIASLQSFLGQRREALCFEGIADPRKARGRRWRLPTLLGAAMWSLLTLGRSLRAAEELTSDLAAAGKRRGIPRRVPDSTLGDALSRLDPEPLRAHLREHIRAEHRRKALCPTVLPLGVVAIDGKEIARSNRRWHRECQEQTSDNAGAQYAMRVLNASLVSATAPVCIDQMVIAAETNEMGSFEPFLRGLVSEYGRSGMIEVVSTDAGMTSEHNARLVNDLSLGYVMALKGNQPELEAEARRVLAAPIARWEPEAETDWRSDSSRGVICYQLYRTAEMAGWGAWSHLRQVWLVRVLRRPVRSAAGPVQILEERLYVTNLLWGRLGADKILDLVRAHWRIENELHGALDIQWKEDQGFWVRRGHGLPVCALLRALAFNLLSLLRAVHLRSDEARALSWRQLRDQVRDALLSMVIAEPMTEVAPVTSDSRPLSHVSPCPEVQS